VARPLPALHLHVVRVAVAAVNLLLVLHLRHHNVAKAALSRRSVLASRVRDPLHPSVVEEDLHQHLHSQQDAGVNLHLEAPLLVAKSPGMRVLLVSVANRLLQRKGGNLPLLPSVVGVEVKVVHRNAELYVDNLLILHQSQLKNLVAVHLTQEVLPLPLNNNRKEHHQPARHHHLKLVGNKHRHLPQQTRDAAVGKRVGARPLQRGAVVRRPLLLLLNVAGRTLLVLLQRMGLLHLLHHRHASTENLLPVP